jgi:hypothetical protein
MKGTKKREKKRKRQMIADALAAATH